MLNKSLKSLLLAALLAGTAGAAMAQDIMLRATANSHEQDEDYDGLVVFKHYVEKASNGAIGVVSPSCRLAICVFHSSLPLVASTATVCPSSRL